MSSRSSEQLLWISAIVGLFVGAVCAFSNPSGRIYNGVAAPVTSFPYVVSLMVGGQTTCSGVIVNRRTVITTASCLEDVSPDTLLVRVGTKRRLSGGTYLYPSNLTIHESYNSTTRDYDIGIVRFQEPLNYTTYVRKVQMPDSSDTVADNVLGTIAGWGRLRTNGSLPNTLRYARVRTVSQKICTSFLSPDTITDRMLCAGNVRAKGGDACEFDNGGPLIINSKLYGLISWGQNNKCALQNKPHVYTRITEFLDWISDTLVNEYNESVF